MQKTTCLWLSLVACHAIGADSSPTDVPASPSLVGGHAVGTEAGVRPNAERGRPDDIDVAVVLDPGEQAGQASATVRIRARREVVWSLITSCPAALTLVPGLVKCEVLETSADHSWQIIRHVVDYSWFVRKLDYRIRASYDKPNHVSIERISGDLKTLKAGWSLEADGDFTVARYRVDLAPGFWVPRWLVRSALKHDLPTMLRALRTQAEGAALGS